MGKYLSAILLFNQKWTFLFMERQMKHYLQVVQFMGIIWRINLKKSSYMRVLGIA